MTKFRFFLSVAVWGTVFLTGCEIVDDDIRKHVPQDDVEVVSLDDVAGILSAVPLDRIHLHEVHSAVCSSSGNGYDEEYTMKDLFERPGGGVGDSQTKAPSNEYLSNPLRALIEKHVRSGAMVKSSGEVSIQNPDKFLEALTSSDIQIYWPYSENWDGEEFPVITFDPEGDAETNVGYRIVCDRDGSRRVENVTVDEQMAMNQPVWVVNRNSDAGYMSLEKLRREDPSWGEGGGTVIVKPSKAKGNGESSLKSLILKDFTMKRNFDPWFAGASEFFVKTGYVEDFTASTEAELKLYSPTVTDFLVVVKRSQVGIPQPFNAMLVSDWSTQMTHCAFMITEDDGGTRQEWKCTALVRVASKSYGIEVNLPFNSRDDYVWRGQLSNRWLEENSDVTAHFGDVDLTFEVVSY